MHIHIKSSSKIQAIAVIKMVQIFTDKMFYMKKPCSPMVVDAGTSSAAETGICTRFSPLLLEVE